MVESIDRLADWAFLDTELEAIHRNVLTTQEYSKPKNIVLYALYKEGIGTGVTMLLTVESVDDGLTALNWFLGPINMRATVLVHSEESIANCYRIDSLRVVLNKFRYYSKIEFPGSDKLYSYHRWMDQLILD